MRLLSVFLGILILSGNSSCKKGEGDPAFTFKSRHKRMSGDWKIKEGLTSVSFKNQQTVLNVTTYSFTANEYQIAVVGKGTIKEAHTLYLSIGAEDDFEMTENFGQVTKKLKGHWDFLGKRDDFKNKERILFNLQSESSNPGSYIYFNKGLNAFTFAIEALGNKEELILRTDEELLAATADGEIYLSSRYVFSR